MSDYTKLKELAEAANVVMGDVRVEMTIASEEGPNQAEIDAVTAFMASATPAAVLALIAENERLTGEEEEASAVVDRLFELLAGVSIAVRGPYLPLQRHSYHDLPQRVETLVSERDQLKTENTGLKTGYEAYEQVSAQLKAESEALASDNDLLGHRNAKLAGELSRLRGKHGDYSYGPGADDAPYLFSMALDMSTCTIDRNGEPFHFDSSEQHQEALKDAERYRWLRDECGIVEYKSIACIGLGMLPSGEKLDAVIDAAMGKGEKS